MYGWPDDADEDALADVKDMKPIEYKGSVLLSFTTEDDKVIVNMHEFGGLILCCRVPERVRRSVKKHRNLTWCSMSSD